MFDASTKSEADKGKKKRRRHSLFSFFSFSVLGGAPCFPFRSCRRAAPIPTSRPPTRDSPLDAWSIGKTIGGGRDSRIRTRESWMKKIEKKMENDGETFKLDFFFSFLFFTKGTAIVSNLPKVSLVHHSSPSPPPLSASKASPTKRLP